MSHDRLWAPWRLAYVTGESSGAQPIPEPVEWQRDADKDCFLCRAAAKYEPSSGSDRRLLVIARDANAIVVLNRFPYNNGHLLISPLRHVGELSLMTGEQHLTCMTLLAKLTTLYREKLHADGFNVGLNLGRVAGAGLPGHLHWHLVPRWAGDNNFMPVLAGTRVIPQSLDALWELLTATPEHE
ncbi:MAG TPA: HIT domain-containing protein [Lacipirellulaceae bacterium]|nr:HIT domain-containing protein [Lacipirellulaceae bacterium]